MALYLDGYSEARHHMMNADLEELLSTIDALYGRDNLEYGATLEEVRDEALRQIKEEFTDKGSEEYSRVHFFKNLHQVTKEY